MEISLPGCAHFMKKSFDVMIYICNNVTCLMPNYLKTDNKDI